MAVRKPILLVALGGNALIRKGQQGTIPEQLENLRVPLRQIARLAEAHRIIITHGNGPQVGNLLLQQECCSEVPRLPLEILVAQTQGQIGYMIESTLDSELMSLGVDKEHYIVSVLSYVVVNEDDPAFLHPSKPIGPAFNEAEAARLPYPTVRTDKGYRRVVASPKPVTIVEKREIKRLIDLGFIVISCGGGGIPVIRDSRTFHGVDAVIDKDLASARLAGEIGVDIFLIATDVEGVALHYEQETRRSWLRSVSVGDAGRFLEEGHFPPGSMGPKVEACIEFMKHGGTRAVIASIERIEAAVQGAAGTEFAP
ncbi:carbamate kinase [Syntrophobacter fumaroxidans]|uniref:Carbamate kinase n=1 Tax=Syntrophobacter fumaroxidans (strain DSM 10017 / MPOB) TaxID=335543 RepID=A0LE98_SYNFM|nr:carbamate kinase [Syntrophobacter fumaroxidans]ABK15750.1 carbamate kinase [Syntrophobacter fumaroxidans MPOB]